MLHPSHLNPSYYVNRTRRQTTLRVLTTLIALIQIPAFAASPALPRAGINDLPTPDASPLPPPSPADIARAAADGRTDGNPDGSREARERGPAEGRQAGLQIGYSQGFQKCQADEQQKAYNLGVQDGYRAGDLQGAQDGQSKGLNEGQRDGYNSGTQDGQSRADDAANRDATPPGRAQGYKEADASNAPQQGRIDGLQAGDEAAQQDAHDIDYARGRKDFRDKKVAEDIVNRDTFAQKAALGDDGGIPGFSTGAELRPYSINPLDVILGGADPDVANPDYRYSNPRRTYGSNEENNAYQQGYRDGYRNGFLSDYQNAYDITYRQGYDQGYNNGCYDAQRRDYSADRNRGYQDGYNQQYNVAYQRTYPLYYRQAYDLAFSDASRKAYDATYPGAYNRHYQDARASAYRERYNELYYATYNPAKKEKYDQVYPGYAQAQYKLGLADEEQDFKDRPVRLQDASVTETSVNGVFEPGEPLRIRFHARNFGADALAGKDIKIRIEALDQNRSVIAESESTLVQDLRAKSLTDVLNALDFQLTEQAVGKTASYRFHLTYNGKDCGTQDLSVKGQFATQAQVDGTWELSEGLPRPIHIKVTNTSKAPTDAGDKAVLKTSLGDVLELLNPEQELLPLAAGDSRTLEYMASFHSTDVHTAAELMLSVLNAKGRRIGVMDTTQSADSVNDYHVTVPQTPDTLRQAGTSRVEYVITHERNGGVPRGLQLKVQVLGKNAANFTVLGPNPQYLRPLDMGKQIKFIVPIQAQAASSGGTLELAIQEDGKPVVTHRLTF